MTTRPPSWAVLAFLSDYETDLTENPGIDHILSEANAIGGDPASGEYCKRLQQLCEEFETSRWKCQNARRLLMQAIEVSFTLGCMIDSRDSASHFRTSERQRLSSKGSLGGQKRKEGADLAWRNSVRQRALELRASHPDMKPTDLSRRVCDEMERAGVHVSLDSIKKFLFKLKADGVISAPVKKS